MVGFPLHSKKEVYDREYVANLPPHRLKLLTHEFNDILFRFYRLNLVGALPPSF